MVDEFTVRELAIRAAPGAGGDEIEKIVRQIRHWTQSRLFHPLGQLHTGPGSHRKYSPDTAYVIAVLLELDGLHMPVGVLGIAASLMPGGSFWLPLPNADHQEEFQPFLDEWMKRWNEAILGERQVLFRFWPTGPATLNNPAFIYPEDGIVTDDMVGAIAINLTKLFNRFRE
jgi:hypothetical protein